VILYTGSISYHIRRNRRGEKRKERREWWYTPVIPALGILRQDDLEVQATPRFTTKPCLKKKRDKRNPRPRSWVLSSIFFGSN
jgi:hypothetical protein